MDPITAAINAVTAIVSRIWPDASEEKKAALAAALQVQNNEFQLALAQINASAGMSFRDGAGWVCVVGLAFVVLKGPVEWACSLAGHPVTLPPIDTNLVWSILGPLLGLGGFHMYEQTKK